MLLLAVVESQARAGFDSMTALDDWSSAWEDVVKEGGKWGGRGHGGRGMGRITQLHAGKDVVLEGVTMSFEVACPNPPPPTPSVASLEVSLFARVLPP
jgi:hypothetical protein